MDISTLLDPNTSLQIQQFLNIGIVGAMVSYGIQVFKEHTTAISGAKAKLLLVGISCIVGAIFYLIANSNYLTTVIGILGSSSVFYGFFLKKTSQEEPIVITYPKEENEEIG